MSGSSSADSGAESSRLITSSGSTSQLFFEDGGGDDLNEQTSGAELEMLSKLLWSRLLDWCGILLFIADNGFGLVTFGLRRVSRLSSGELAKGSDEGSQSTFETGFALGRGAGGGVSAKG